MKRMALRGLSLVLVVCLLLSMGMTAALAYNGYDFGFHVDDEGSSWAEWLYKKNGLKFRVKIENYSYCDYIDSFTIALSVKNESGMPLELKASDGEWYDTPLWYTSKMSYKPGRVAMSEYFNLQSYDDIGSVTATIVKYHIRGGGTVEIDPFDYDTRTWTID